MKKQLAIGHIPYEPLDKIKLKNNKHIFRIREMRMIQYIVSNKVEFQVQLSYGSRLIDEWVDADRIEKRIITK